MFRSIVAILLVTTIAIAKKKPVPEEWQTGTLIRIVPYVPGGADIPEAQADAYWQISPGSTGLIIRGVSAQGEAALWTAILGPDEREPNVRVGREVKYAVGTAPCPWRYAFESGEASGRICGYTETRDQFGRTHKTAIKTREVLFLLDEGGHKVQIAKAGISSSRAKK